MNRSIVIGAGLLGLATTLSFAPSAQASPLMPAAPLSQIVDDNSGVEQAYYYRRHRHYHRHHHGWWRGHHYGWRHHHHRRYGYYRGYY